LLEFIALFISFVSSLYFSIDSLRNKNYNRFVWYSFLTLMSIVIALLLKWG